MNTRASPLQHRRRVAVPLAVSAGVLLGSRGQRRVTLQLPSDPLQSPPPGPRPGTFMAWLLALAGELRMAVWKARSASPVRRTSQGLKRLLQRPRYRRRLCATTRSGGLRVCSDTTTSGAAHQPAAAERGEALRGPLLLPSPPGAT